MNSLIHNDPDWPFPAKLSDMTPEQQEAFIKMWDDAKPKVIAGAELKIVAFGTPGPFAEDMFKLFTSAWDAYNEPDNEIIHKQ